MLLMVLKALKAFMVTQRQIITYETLNSTFRHVKWQFGGR